MSRTRSNELPPIGETPQFRYPRNVFETYQPVPPFRFHFGAYAKRPMFSEDWMSLEAAMHRFGDFALPVQDNHVAFIIDSQLMMVFGYGTTDEMVEFWGRNGIWLGCGKAYRIAADLEIMDQLELAVCEGIARECNG